MKKLFTLLTVALMGASMWALTPLDGDSWNDATKTLTVNSNPSQSAYISQSEIEHLIIGNAVTNIGVSAFEYCTNLTSVTFGNQLLNLEQYAFCACHALSSVELPNSLTKIESGAFSYCGALASVTIGTCITKIEAFAFMDCGSLTSFTCQATNPPTLDYRTFNGCTYLSQIYVPAESLNAYKTATNWSAYASIIKAIGNEDQPAWVQPGDSWDEDTRTLTVNSNPGDGAYANNEDIKYVIISDGVTSIGYGAFYYCTYLASIEIPNTVTSIEDYAFYYCEYRLTSIEIPNSVKSIGEYAFAYCIALESVTIGDGVTSIGNYAFEECYYLTSLTIGNSVTNIGDYAFYFCEKLTSVEIPNSVESIGVGAFKDCADMNSLIIGNGITSIGDHAFYECIHMTSVTCEAVNPPTIGEGVFNECNYLSYIYVPAESVEAYKTATNWSEYEPLIEAIPSDEAIDHTAADANITKRLENGQLIIIKNGQRFNANGVEVR